MQRASVLRGALQSGRTLVHSQRFASAGAEKFPIYEMRTYNIVPAHYPAFLKLTAEKIHMRTSHSPLLGYWTSELGGLNEVIHIWGYQSLVQRQKVRNALGTDNKWSDEYMARMRPMIQSQENIIMVPESENIIESFPASDEVDLPAYELEVLLSTEQFGNENRTSLGGQLVGQWKGVVGNLNGSTVQLWRYPTLDHVDTVLRSPKGMMESQQLNKILLPTSFSSLY